MQRLVARFALVAALSAATLGVTMARRSAVTAHEWGTFTTVAGQDGRSVDWIPLGGPVDLPCFVNVFGAAGDPTNALFGKVAGIVVRQVIPTPEQQKVLQNGSPLKVSLLTYDQARSAMLGKVRMETPVIYFYSPERTSVDVTVRFPQGLVSEWYPAANVRQPQPQMMNLSQEFNSSIFWGGVDIQPGANAAFPTEKNPSHYYPARETDAAPVFVNGQAEKFLFYRGIGGFDVPIEAVENADGSIKVKNTGTTPIPAVILFENRDGMVGYRVHNTLTGETVLQRAALNSSVGSLGRDLEKLLVATGLYEREATAMVKTWTDSWFEEGARLFYILPQSTVDEVLPLTISPAPEKTARAFVGRVELITQETVNRVVTALEKEDEEMLLRYGRFLGPITDRALEVASPALRESTRKYVDALFRAYVTRNEVKCTK